MDINFRKEPFYYMGFDARKKLNLLHVSNTCVGQRRLTSASIVHILWKVSYRNLQCAMFLISRYTFWSWADWIEPYRIAYHERQFSIVEAIGVAPITQVRTCEIKILIFKGGHLML